jgi:hypothetical protein
MDEGRQQIKLPRLQTNGNNWVIYCDRLIWALQIHSIEDHIQFTTPPTSYTDLGIQDNLEPDACWRKEEGIIKLAMEPTLPDAAFSKVKDAPDIKTAWDGLKELYEQQTKALVADAIQRFQNKHCEEDKSVRSHFQYLANLCEQLAGMGRTISNNDYTDTLLASLPASYSGSIQSISTLAHLGGITITPAVVEGLIIDKFECRKIYDNNKTKEAKNKALTAESSKAGKNKDKRNIECFNCKKKGHYKSECYAKGGGQEG